MYYWSIEMIQVARDYLIGRVLLVDTAKGRLNQVTVVATMVRWFVID
jgi:hypothetical protein